ncbi:MAG: hypothetical protein JHC87_09620 [Thermoleophilaceae bacterium]|nr:hypothetical protein [Thermoleophilaceae bacterium]
MTIFSNSRTKRSARVLTCTAALALCAAFALASSASAITPGQEQQLSGKIQSLSGRIGDLQKRVDAAQQRENAAQAVFNKQLARQQQVAAELQSSRAELARLRGMLAHARHVLTARIVTEYKAGQPDYLTVVLNSDGFAAMVERATYLNRVNKQDKRVISDVRTLKAESAKQTTHLAALEHEQGRLLAQVRAHRDQLAGRKSQLAAQVGGLTAELHKNRSRLAAATATLNGHENAGGPAAPSPIQKFAPTLGPAGRVTLQANGLAIAPSDAPASIQAAVAAGNQIRNKPYIWGGGHGSFNAAGYDCSGSVSYVLHAAGVLSSPMASGPLESWGSPGPGNWITVYANAGHVWMTVGGVAFDTSGIGGNGSRWQPGGKPTGGYVVRHWPGL